MIRALAATGALALGGSTFLVPPASQYLGWFGWTALGLAAFFLGLSLVDAIAAYLRWRRERMAARARNSWRVR